MGLLDMLGYGNNPLYKAFDANRGKISGAFSGMVGAGNDPRMALQGFVGGLQHGQSVDQENAIIAQKKAQDEAAAKAEQDKQNQTIAWLQQNAPKYADAVKNGAMSPGDAWNAALKDQQPAGGKPPIEVNGQLVDPETHQVVGDYRTPPAPEKPPASVQEYQFAQGQGYKGTYEQFKTDMAKAGATTIDFNQNQSIAAGFADRMSAANQVLNDPKLLAAMTDPTKGPLSAVPGVGNYLVGAEFQQAQQAQRDFVNAILRRESGAVISPSEFENAKQQYFPQPGDSPEVLAQKAQNREIAIQGVIRGAGPSYVPPTMTPPGVTAPNTTSTGVQWSVSP